MTIHTHTGAGIPTHHQRRLDPASSDVLKVRLEHTLAAVIKDLQDHPAVVVKGSRKPSRSLILRRAIGVYAAHLKALKPEDYDREIGEVAKLA
ncbi:hypothetical protein WS85_12885 [Burkholderia anthina]|uniref:hypothetical protein n=1 Tax=Burkholderia anthina TaxID=179879 RepID=UPI000755AC59|nr:hypothetical protein [Burkholderia anthina]KVH12227.1 hypothetical protein WS85_12885 [Burkholderia anthina]KVX39305.1 hypothetical protein WT32_06790 [Burkholderia anthina]